MTAIEDELARCLGSECRASQDEIETDVTRHEIARRCGRDRTSHRLQVTLQGWRGPLLSALSVSACWLASFTWLMRTLATTTLDSSVPKYGPLSGDHHRLGEGSGLAGHFRGADPELRTGTLAENLRQRGWRSWMAENPRSPFAVRGSATPARLVRSGCVAQQEARPPPGGESGTRFCAPSAP